jgi:transposase
MVSRPVFLGIDVSKATLDLAVRPSGETWQVPNDPAAMPALVTRVRAAAPALIVPRGHRWL